MKVKSTSSKINITIIKRCMKLKEVKYVIKIKNGGKILKLYYISNLSCYQFKIDWYINRILYVKLMLTTKGKFTVNT